MSALLNKVLPIFSIEANNRTAIQASPLQQGLMSQQYRGM